MPDIENPDDPDAPDEAAWPAAPESWARWEPRVTQVFVLHAIVIGPVALLRMTGLVSQKTANWLLGFQVPALTFAWLGLVVYLIVRARERSEGVLERGRTLVLGLDLFTVIFAVIGVGFWLAVFAV